MFRRCGIEYKGTHKYGISYTQLYRQNINNIQNY